MAKKKKKAKEKSKKKAVVKKAVKKKKTAKRKRPTARAKPKPRKKNKGGGQTKYQESFPDRALTYAEVGQFAHSRLAKKFKVSIPTIKNWIDNHSKFADAVEEGKKIAVEAVDSTYYEQALGLVKVKKGYLPPNERACNKILTANREEYKNKQEVNVESQSLVDIIAKVGIGKKRKKK